MDMVNGLQDLEQKEQSQIEINFFHCDHLGTPIGLTDAKNNLIWASRMDPWGNNEEEFNPKNIDQPIGLPGQLHDRESNLYYNLHRYYDPSIGGYINQDPIGLKGALNFYSYSGNQPLQSIDPLGLADYPVRSWSPLQLILFTLRLKHFYSDNSNSPPPLPVGSKLCSYEGKTFYAPPDVNFNEVYNDGLASIAKKMNNPNYSEDANVPYYNGMSHLDDGSFVVGADFNTGTYIGLFGKYDYQRDTQNNIFIPQYTDASNFAVGVFMAATGASEHDMIFLGRAFAFLTQSKGDINKKIEFWKAGWSAANSGNLGCCK